MISTPDAKLDNDPCKAKPTAKPAAPRMAMLMNFGGVRKSEFFHIYTSDITLHPTRLDEALVRIYHPVYGQSPDQRYKNRMEYLSAETSYQPRDQYPRSKRLHADWKGALLTDTETFLKSFSTLLIKLRCF